MSRDAGTTLDERLVTYLVSGGPAMVARVTPEGPECALARGVGATETTATLSVIGEARVGDRVSVHTLGEVICAIFGDIASAEPHGDELTVVVDVHAVKDDRPPGLAVEPFILYDGSPAR